MLPFSATVAGEIRLLLQSVNDSNFDSIYRELCQVRETPIFLISYDFVVARVGFFVLPEMVFGE